MKSIIKKLIKNKRRLMIFALVGALAIFLLPHLALAAPATKAAAQTTASSADKIYQEMVDLLILVMEFLQRLIWPVLLMIGGLLKNDLLFGAGMEEVMLAIWGNIRNIVNILFVLILLGIAFYNVVGGSSQDYHIKAILPRFVIALIVVNFSFLGVKVVLDGVNVVSTALFALPGAVEENLKDPREQPNFQKNVCEGIYGKKDYATAIATAEKEASANADNEPFCDIDKKFKNKASAFFAQFDSNNAAIVMAINLMEINTLDVVKVSKPDAKNLAINVLFSIVLYIVYAVSFVALLIILLVRLVVLWVTIVMSPLIALAFVLPESLKSTLGSGGDLKTQFVKNAIVPIPVALAMSIGFIMLQSLKQAKFSNVALETSALGVNLLTSGLSTLQDLIVAVGTVAIIWMGVFKAAEGTAAQGIVGKIKEATEGFGKFVATAPFKYAPIIPVKEGGEKVSLGTALGALREIPYGLERSQQQKSSELAGRYSGVNLAEAGKKMKESKNPKELMQHIVDNGRGQEGNAQFQRYIGDSLHGRNSGFLNQLRWDSLKNKEGEVYKNQQLAIEALRKGEVDEKSLEEWMRVNSRKLGVTPQTTGAATTPPGTAGQHPAGTGAQGKTGGQPTATPAQKAAATAGVAGITGEVAHALISANSFDTRKNVLNEDQKKAIEKAAGEKGNEENFGEELKNADVQTALSEIEKVRKGSEAFGEEISNAFPLGKADRYKKVVQIIIKRKEEVTAQIKKNNPNLSDDDVQKRVNQIVQLEMDSAPPGMRQDVSTITATQEGNPGA